MPLQLCLIVYLLQLLLLYLLMFLVLLLQLISKPLKCSFALTSLWLPDPARVAILTAEFQIGTSGTWINPSTPDLGLVTVIAGRSEFAFWVKSRVIRSRDN
jgi:hypothetical protein